MTPRPARTTLRISPHDDPPCDLPRGPEPGSPRLVPAAAGFTPGQLEIFVTGGQFTVSGERTGDGDPGRPLDAVGAGLARDLPTVEPAQPAHDRAWERMATAPAAAPPSNPSPAWGPPEG